jgi:hypothetical protein
MGLALTAALAFCLWIVLWAIGVKSFDGFMITLVILLVAGTLKSLTKFLPGASRGSGSNGGW